MNTSGNFIFYCNLYTTLIEYIESEVYFYLFPFPCFCTAQSTTQMRESAPWSIKDELRVTDLIPIHNMGLREVDLCMFLMVRSPCIAWVDIRHGLGILLLLVDSKNKTQNN